MNGLNRSGHVTQTNGAIDPEWLFQPCGFR